MSFASELIGLFIKQDEYLFYSRHLAVKKHNGSLRVLFEIMRNDIKVKKTFCMGIGGF